MKKFLLILFAVFCLIPALLFASLKLPVFGARPSDDDARRFARSQQYNSHENIFENRQSALFDQMRSESSLIDMTQEWFTPRKNGSPIQALPQIEPELSQFLEESDYAKIIWLGHSSFLLNLDGVRILIDPVFSNTAAPVSFTAKRFQAPVLTLNQLPHVDIILISHDHYDHLDMKTIQFFANTNTEFITPLGVGIHLQRWGIAAPRIKERDWWESTVSRGIEFIATPAQHFSGRNGINNNETLWASWVLLSSQARLFFSGDSGYDNHFKEIGNRFGPFDMAFLENGQYDLSWEMVHMLPHQTAQAFVDLNARLLFPIHWGMFELAFHTWYDPVVSLARIADEQNIPLVTPLIGEVLELSKDLSTERWWEKLTP